jgi:tyrosyl-tRNA synthetase
LFAVRNAISSTKEQGEEKMKKSERELLEYKRSYATSSTAQSVSGTTFEQPKSDGDDVVTLPLSMLQAGSFPTVLHAAGLASSKSEANRLIAKKGAYVLVPNSGPPENPTALKWATIEPGKEVDPNHYLVDWEALVLRSGKTRVQICEVVKDVENNE